MMGGGRTEFGDAQRFQNDGKARRRVGSTIPVFHYLLFPGAVFRLRDRRGRFRTGDNAFGKLPQGLRDQNLANQDFARSRGRER